MDVTNLKLPCLPGYSFNTNFLRTSFHLDPKFDVFGGEVRGLREKVKPNMFGPLTDRYPSLYATGEATQLPAWVVFDKQALCFDAVSMPTLANNVKRVKVYFFLEDGTVRVVEPKVENSGVAQGTLISRRRVRFGGHMDHNFYDIIDLNIGHEVEFYGQPFKIINCDKFTRTFLNRCGISVPDPIATTGDSSVIRENLAVNRPPRPRISTLQQFLANDKQVLRFYGHWDDTASDNGYLHHFEVLFYLSNDTIEINEFVENSSQTFLFLKRSRLRRHYYEVEADDEPTGGGGGGGGRPTTRFIEDRINDTNVPDVFYRDIDFKLGQIITCYGRKILLTACDAFTRRYYKEKHNIECPQMDGEGENTVGHVPPKVCYRPAVTQTSDKAVKQPADDTLRNLKLRYRAKMVSNSHENTSREFIVTYQLSNDTIAVTETTGSSSTGVTKQQFFSARRIRIPGAKLSTCEETILNYYTAQDMFIGAVLAINNFYFVLTEADEFTLKYMEDNSTYFPKSNIKTIMEKIKTVIRPIYKNFIADEVTNETVDIPYQKMREKLCSLLANDFTEHEMLTIARAFPPKRRDQTNDERESLRKTVLHDLKTHKWDDHRRLEDYFTGRDPYNRGSICPEIVYHILRICRLPFDRQFINKIFNVVKQDEKQYIDYKDLLDFLDDSIAIDQTAEQRDASKAKTGFIDWTAFLKYLNLESSFTD